MSDPGAWLGTGLQLAHVPVRATVLLLLAFALALLLRRKAASLRHQLWVITCVGLLLLPVPALLLLAGVGSFSGLRVQLLPALPLPPPDRGTITDSSELLASQGRSIRHLAMSWRRPASEAETRRSQGLMPPDAAPADPPRPLPLAGVGLTALWFAGAGLVLVRAGLARRRARALLRLSRPADIDLWPGIAGADARETDAVDLPITVGALRPVILLPRAGRDWPLDWRRSAVAHEVAHLRRRDPLWQLLAELATALHWYHPLAWAAARRLRIERELAADDDVLLQGNRGSDYAQLLVTLACAPDAPVAAGAVLPLLTPAGLKARLLGILSPARIRQAPRAAMFLLGLGSVLALVPVAAALPVRAIGGPVATGSPVGQYVVGRVVDGASGQPLGGVEVDFLIAHRVLRTTTAADGQIRSPVPGKGPPQEVFILYARQGAQAARTTVMAVPFGTKLPIELRLHPAHRLRGTVTTADGRPVAGAGLHIIDWQAHAVGPGGGELARTRADGSFVIDGLLYGDYSLLAVAPSGLAVLHRLPIGDTDPPPAALRLPDTRRVTARLRDEDGRPLAGVRVERAPSENMYPRGRTGERHVDWDVSGADGSVRLLPLGETLVAGARDAQGRTIEALFNDGGVPRWKLPRALGFDRMRFVTREHEFGQPRADRLVLLQRPAVLAIRVEDTEGRPVPGVRPQVDPATTDPAWTLRARARTDGDGRIPDIAVPPGTMVVALSPNGRPQASVREVLTVKAGEQKQVRLVIPSTPAR